MADRIFVSNLCIYAHHGVMPEENKLGLRLYLDIDCEVDLTACLVEDDYHKAVCYGSLVEIATQVSDAHRFNLLESFADRIARTILDRYENVKRTTVTIRKPSAPIPATLDHAGVEITRRREDLQR